MAAVRLVFVIVSVFLTVYVHSGEDSSNIEGYCHGPVKPDESPTCENLTADASSTALPDQSDSSSEQNTAYVNEVIVLTVATEENEGYRRFVRSANIYGLKLEVLGLNEKWRGGDVLHHPGGGHKVNLLKEAIEKYKDKSDLILMFVDSYDVMFTAGKDQILEKFFKFKAKVLFSAEGFCWPDKSLSERYPKSERGNQYLNSGGFLGYAPQVYEIVTSSDIQDIEDDQLFYTKIYLEEDLRKKWSIKLDHRAEIFQNLNGAVGDVELRGLDSEAYVHNTAFGTRPLIIHGNGPSKTLLNSLGNYIAKSWNSKEGCLVCEDDKISLAKKKVSELPRVIMSLFVEHPTPFLQEFLDKVMNIDYPKEKIDLFVHNGAELHAKAMDDFIEKNREKYHSVMYLKFEADYKEWHARNLGLEECMKLDCDYYFSLDSDAHVDNPTTLRILIEQNRLVVAPMVKRDKGLWSNFWGALSVDGFYARSHDYVEIAKQQRKGLWNVPFVGSIYLLNGSLLKSRDTFPSFINGQLDPDMAFCKHFRDKGIFMHVNNMYEFGHLVNSEDFDTTKTHPDFYEIFTNQKDWERRYIHTNYSKVLQPDYKLDMPCHDVFWFPVVTETFCQHLIEIMEAFGQWSDGTNQDPRIAGGYENVPTRDIHMNQVGFEQRWLYFLGEYITPVQEKVFIGYSHFPPKAIMNFVVRYHPNEQPFLRPHHDSSTYTINIALNTPHKDYEGGGCRFLRYNCSVVDLRRGWALMHPGRLTHYHEGLPVKSGTRYIMVSFVDP